MSSALYTAGIIFLCLSTFFRSLENKNRKSPLELFRIPSQASQNEILLFTGQFMGILWIGLGAILEALDGWISLSNTRIIVSSFSIFAPFLISGVALKLLLRKK